MDTKKDKRKQVGAIIVFILGIVALVAGGVWLGLAWQRANHPDITVAERLVEKDQTILNGE